MATTHDSGPLTRQAYRLANTRRSLMTHLDGDLGIPLAFDQMGVPIEAATAGHYAFAKVVVATEVEGLRRSELYVADDALCALLDAATPGMPDQVLREDDLLSSNGFVAFAQPLPDRTGQGVPLAVHALSWHYLHDGHPMLEPTQSPASVLIVAYVSTVETAQKMLPGPIQDGAPRWLPNATVVWTVGTEIGSAFGTTPVSNEGEPGFYQRLAAAFWTLAQQPRLTEQDSATPPKNERRRFGRAGIERPDEPVHIVRMSRRPARPTETGDDAEKRTVNWQHQWLVKAHWRRQWLPSKQTHRQQLILPYVKGPEDKPFMGGEKVFVVSGRDIAPPAR